MFTRKALIAGAKTVVAIEPGPENIESLRRTFASEIAEGRVIVYPKGVWDREDVLRLNVDPNNSARDSFMGGPEGDHTVEAKLTTIDKLVEELKLPRVDFIKMDIEGAEPKALDGAKHTLTANHPRMALCIYHGEQDYVTIPRVVLAAVPSYQYQKTCLCALDRVQPEVAFFF